MAVSDELFAAVKNYLDITWQDADTDIKLRGIISRGTAYLNTVAGQELDYQAEEKPRELLFDYCRYVRDSALDEYQARYLPELLSLQMQSEAARYGTDASDV